MAIAVSHGGQSIFSSREPSRDVLVGTARGVARLVRDGAGWQLQEHSLSDKHISAILVEPQSGLIFAGAYNDGSLHVSRDDGHTWQASDAGIEQKSIYSIVAVPNGASVRLWLGTQPAHLYSSDDLGRSWQERPGLRGVPTVDKWTFPGPPPNLAHTKTITAHPHNPSTLYVGIEVGGLFRSSDEGASWQEIPNIYEDVHRVLIPDSGPNMYLATGNGLYISRDGGDAWERLTMSDHEIGGYPDPLVYRPSDPNTLFVASAHEPPGTWRNSHFAGARISRSRDSGTTWQVLGGGLPDRLQASIEAMTLEESDQSCCLFAATTAGDVLFSEDAGDHWSTAVSGLAPISKEAHYRYLQPAV